jgi:hypothetical protein
MGALMAMVREQEAFVVIAPIVDYAWTAVTRPAPLVSVMRDSVLRLAAAGLGFALGFVPQAAAYLAINGRLGPSTDVASKMYWSGPWAASVVMSPEHGWFFWTPLAALATIGLIGMATSRAADPSGARRIGLLLLLTVATQIYVSGSVATWTLAGAFGQRRFLGMTVCHDRIGWRVPDAGGHWSWSPWRWRSGGPQAGCPVRRAFDGSTAARCPAPCMTFVSSRGACRCVPISFDRSSFYKSRPGE